MLLINPVAIHIFLLFIGNADTDFRACPNLGFAVGENEECVVRSMLFIRNLYMNSIAPPSHPSVVSVTSTTPPSMMNNNLLHPQSTYLNNPHNYNGSNNFNKRNNGSNKVKFTPKYNKKAQTHHRDPYGFDDDGSNHSHKDRDQHYLVLSTHSVSYESNKERLAPKMLNNREGIGWHIVNGEDRKHEHEQNNVILAELVGSKQLDSIQMNDSHGGIMNMNVNMNKDVMNEEDYENDIVEPHAGYNQGSTVNSKAQALDPLESKRDFVNASDEMADAGSTTQNTMVSLLAGDDGYGAVIDDELNLRENSVKNNLNEIKEKYMNLQKENKESLDELQSKTNEDEKYINELTEENGKYKLQISQFNEETKRLKQDFETVKTKDTELITVNNEIEQKLKTNQTKPNDVENSLKSAQSNEERWRNKYTEKEAELRELKEQKEKEKGEIDPEVLAVETEKDIQSRSDEIGQKCEEYKNEAVELKTNLEDQTEKVKKLEDELLERKSKLKDQLNEIKQQQASTADLGNVDSNNSNDSTVSTLVPKLKDAASGFSQISIESKSETPTMPFINDSNSMRGRGMSDDYKEEEYLAHRNNENYNNNLNKTIIIASMKTIVTDDGYNDDTNLEMDLQLRQNSFFNNYTISNRGINDYDVEDTMIFSF